MKKVNIYSIDENNNTIYEFSTIVQTSEKLTKIIIKKALEFTKIENIEKHKRNNIYFKELVNSYKLKGKNIKKLIATLK